MAFACLLPAHGQSQALELQLCVRAQVMLTISFIFSLKMIFSVEEEQLHEQPYLISYGSNFPCGTQKVIPYKKQTANTVNLSGKAVHVISCYSSASV